MKPSKKVTGIMIIILALTSAFIVSDKLKESEKNEEPTVVEGEIESANPVKSIEEYMIDKIAENSNKESVMLNPPKTITEFVLAELLSAEKSLKQNQQNTEENRDYITSSLAIKTKELTKIPIKYNLIDLSTFPDFDKEKIKEYGNSFAEITEKFYKKQFFIDESGSLEFVKEYSEIQKEYAQELSKIKIPRSISDEHLDFINNLNNISISIVMLASMDNDPLFSAMLLKQYDEARLKNPEILIKISDYFINNDIIFSDEDPGVMWDNI